MAGFASLSQRFGEFVDSLAGKKVCVIGHAKPDGDCIGAQVATTRLLRSRGVEAFAVNADPVPRSLQALVRETPVESVDLQRMEGLPLIYVDCADERRVGPMTSRSLKGWRKLANIDHHISNTRFSENVFLDGASAATCELLACFAYDLGWEVDPVTAQALYYGILTDTGRFGYLATTQRVFRLCGRLVADGANPQRAAEELYERERLGRLKLLQRYLNSLEVLCEGQLCVGQVSQRDFIETGTCYEDTEGFVDFARSIETARVGLLIEERKTTCKASLRGKEAALRLDQVAARFGGGGHACAAGLSSSLDAATLRSQLVTEIQSRLREEESRRAPSEAERPG